jgi:DNA-binding MarR family transcriptional regulator
MPPNDVDAERAPVQAASVGARRDARRRPAAQVPPTAGQICEIINLSKPICARHLRDANGYWALPYTIMQISKGAVRTFAGLHEMVDGKTKSTFAEVSTIAEKVGLPPTTVKRHINKLINDCWIENCGRHRRRSRTLKITKTALHIRKNQKFAPLPKWWRDNQCPATALLYATLLGELCKREHLLESQLGAEDGEETDDLEHLRKPDFTSLEIKTGLSRKAITDSFSRLLSEGLIHRWRDHNKESYNIELMIPDRLKSRMNYV